MRFDVLLTLSVSAALLAACSSGAADQPRAGDGRVDAAPDAASAEEAALPPKLCDLVPQADAERIMGKALVTRRNDDWGCEYGDARGTTGTGLTILRNAFTVADQCRLSTGSEPLSGLGDEACIVLRRPAGIYTTVVFGGGGHTFEVIAPGQSRDSELATPTARIVLSKLNS